ncbi:hypothetical protein NDU88_004664 [Pleurodeles waltl]|uniref:Uncharacterized protein n=1 Tax=Pleurodeles waltl TaxID=8319 RepID=A0AAV7WSL6_PLEWA|nr:hypothetical protein NDU88_004664 [Pleurodeles waltl]
MSRGHRPDGVGAMPQKMGKVGRRRDMEQKSGSSAEAQADPPDPRNDASREGRDDPTLQDVLQAIMASCVALEGKIDALASDLTVLRDDHRHLAEKVSTTDKQLKELLPENPEHERRRGAKSNTTRIVNSPSPVEMQTERRKAMEAAASLSGSDRGSQVQTAADVEPSDSDHESETSRVSDGSGPAITPGTSDCII